MPSEFGDYLIPVLTAVVAAYFTSRFHVHRAKAEFEKELESRFNERKWEIYLEFADILRQVLDEVKSKKGSRTNSKHIRKMLEFNSKLWLIGSDDVMRAYLRWLRHSRVANADVEGRNEGLSSVFLLMDVVKAMRADLGYTTSTVSSKDLAATFINDASEYPLLRVWDVAPDSNGSDASRTT